MTPHDRNGMLIKAGDVVGVLCDVISVDDLGRLIVKPRDSAPTQFPIDASHTEMYKPASLQHIKMFRDLPAHRPSSDSPG